MKTIKVLIFSILYVLCCYVNAQKTNDKPNVIVILVDDLGISDLSSYGSTFHETPNIDSIAQSGVKFNNSYSPSPVCSSSRAALQTGKSPEKIKITDWIPGYKEGIKPLKEPSILHELPKKEVTIAEAFKSNGYKTFFAGKWHLGGENYLPDQQGYDINIGGYDRGQPNSYYAPYTNPQLDEGPNGEYLTDRLTNETIDFITENKEQPFFAMLSFYTVHTPITAAKPYLNYYKKKASLLPKLSNNSIAEKNDRFTRKRQDDPMYASMVHALDVNIGRLLTRIKQTGLDKNTIIIFTSDNGGLSTHKDIGPTSNHPYRAGKGWLYEGGIRVPLIISIPGNRNKGTISEVPVIGTDIAPSLLALANLKDHGMTSLDGVSLASLLLDNRKPARKYIKVYYPHYHVVGQEPAFMIRDGDWKLIYSYLNGSSELYNLSDDVGEQNNLSVNFPGKVNRMKSIMFSWLKSINAEQPTHRVIQ